MNRNTELYKGLPISLKEKIQILQESRAAAKLVYQSYTELTKDTYIVRSL